MHGSMSYMQHHFDLRIDPTKLVPGAKSVITILQNYFTEDKQNENAPNTDPILFRQAKNRWIFGHYGVFKIIKNLVYYINVIRNGMVGMRLTFSSNKLKM